MTHDPLAVAARLLLRRKRANTPIGWQREALQDIVMGPHEDGAIFEIRFGNGRASGRRWLMRELLAEADRIVALATGPGLVREQGPEMFAPTVGGRVWPSASELGPGL